MDPEVPVNFRPTSNLPFLSEIQENAVAVAVAVAEAIILSSG